MEDHRQCSNEANHSFHRFFLSSLHSRPPPQPYRHQDCLPIHQHIRTSEGSSAGLLKDSSQSLINRDKGSQVTMELQSHEI